MLNQLLWKDLVAFDDKLSKVCVHCAEFSTSCESEVSIVSVVCIEVAELCTQTDVFFSVCKDGQLNLRLPLVSDVLLGLGNSDTDVKIMRICL